VRAKPRVDLAEARDPTLQKAERRQPIEERRDRALAQLITQRPREQ
jgi:hypothetical protein